MRRRDVPVQLPTVIVRLFVRGMSIATLAAVFDCSQERIEAALRKGGRA